MRGARGVTLLLLLLAADAAAAVVPTAGRVATAWRSPLAAPHRATALRTPLAPSLQIALDADSAAESGQTQTQQYLNSLSRFADDGRTLNAPQRYSSKDWLANLRSISSCRVLEAIRGQLLVQIVWALLISLLYIVAPSLPSLPALPHSLLGGVLGVLLGFRTNQSYDRFWEARKLWSGVFTHCRSLSRMGIAYIDSDRSAYECMQRHLKAFPLALKQHLRGEREPQEFAGTLSTPELNEVISADSMPLAVCTSFAVAVNAIKLDESQSSNALLWWAFEDHIHKLVSTVSECERLVRTPVPLTYSVHTSRLLSLWTGSLPFVLVGCFAPGPLRLLTVPCTAFIAYSLLCTEELGQAEIAPRYARDIASGIHEATRPNGSEISERPNVDDFVSAWHASVFSHLCSARSHMIEEPFGATREDSEVLPLRRYCDSLKVDLDENNRSARTQ